MLNEDCCTLYGTLNVLHNSKVVDNRCCLTEQIILSSFSITCEKLIYLTFTSEVMILLMFICLLAKQLKFVNRFQRSLQEMIINGQGRDDYICCYSGLPSGSKKCLSN